MGLSLEVKAISILALLASLLFGVKAVISAHDRRAVAAVEARYATQALKATIANDAESARREAAQADINNEAQRLSARNRADAAAVPDAVVRLQQRAAVALGGGIAPHPSIAASGATAGDTGDMQAQLLGRLGDAAGRLAAIADERGAAGLACERAYDSLGK